MDIVSRIEKRLDEAVHFDPNSGQFERRAAENPAQLELPYEVDPVEKFDATFYDNIKVIPGKPSTEAVPVSNDPDESRSVPVQTTQFQVVFDHPVSIPAQWLEGTTVDQFLLGQMAELEADAVAEKIPGKVEFHGAPVHSITPDGNGMYHFRYSHDGEVTEELDTTRDYDDSSDDLRDQTRLDYMGL